MRRKCIKCKGSMVNAKNVYYCIKCQPATVWAQAEPVAHITLFPDGYSIETSDKKSTSRRQWLAHEQVFKTQNEATDYVNNFFGGQYVKIEYHDESFNECLSII